MQSVIMVSWLNIFFYFIIFMFTKLIEILYEGLNDDIDRAASDSDDGTIDYEEESSYIPSDPEQVRLLACYFSIIIISFDGKL